MTSPLDFPIHWDNPDDAQLTWKLENDHATTPAQRLRSSFSSELIGPAVQRAYAQLQMTSRFRSLTVNGYSYFAELTNHTSPAPAHDALLQRHIADLPRRWREEFEPELLHDIAAWRAFDLSGASQDELAHYFERLLERQARHWEIHFLTVFPVINSMRFLAQRYVELTGDKDEQAVYRLVAGFPSKTTERDTALHELAELARRTPAVSAAFTQHTNAQLLIQLRAASEAQAFVRACAAYIETYGERSEGELDRPTWREDPAFVFIALRAILNSAPRDPHAELAAAAAAREQFVAATLAKIPADKRDEFMMVLQGAQGCYPLRETHAFFIDQMSAAHFRYAVLELGRRFTQRGIIAQRDDVFHFELSELRELARSPQSDEWRERPAQRRAEYARWLQLTPPPFIGKSPEATNAAPTVATQIKGIAASKGVARGVARVIHTMAEFARVQAGDVLVCPTTFPPWTSLFRTITALVTDAGGVLSHGAIVAREYQLPAVVAAANATRTIQDGQYIEVDGTRGTVTILS
jgi:pyruvate,water dikinase